MWVYVPLYSVGWGTFGYWYWAPNGGSGSGSW